MVDPEKGEDGASRRRGELQRAGGWCKTGAAAADRTSPRSRFPEPCPLPGGDGRAGGRRTPDDRPDSGGPGQAV